MRRCVLTGLTLCLMLLCGCAVQDKPMQDALSFRQKLLSSGGCAFTADVTADYGDYQYSFSLHCTYRDGRGEATVSAPDLISGIHASCTGSASEISFDGAVLELGDLLDGSVSPLCVPWLFGSAWEGDEITAASKDEESARISIQKGYDEERILLDTWLTDEIPISGEVTGDNGRRILCIQFRDFQFSDGKP